MVSGLVLEARRQIFRVRKSLEVSLKNGVRTGP